MISFIGFVSMLFSAYCGYNDISFLWTFAIAIAIHPSHLLRSEHIYQRYLSEKNTMGMTQVMVTCYFTAWIAASIGYGIGSIIG